MPKEPESTEAEELTGSETSAGDETEKETEEIVPRLLSLNTEKEEGTLPSDECICQEKCGEENMNEFCPVCGADNAGPEDCLGGENVIILEEYMEIPEDLLADLPDNDELFAGYVEQAFYGDDGIELYGNFGEDRLEGVTRYFYQVLKSRVAEIAAGSRTSTRFSIPFSELGITQTEWTYKELGVGTFQEAVDVLKKRITPDLETTFDYLRINCPYELYWFDKTKKSGIEGISYSGKNETVTIPEEIIMYMPVSVDYQGDDLYTADSKKTKATKAAADNAQAIVTKYQKEDDYNKLKAYLNEIKSLVSYNHIAADTNNYPYGDPWQLIYVFDKDSSTNVVCEGYSKAFQYLCDLSEFEEEIICYTVTGNAGGPHMWNIVTMEDGENYLVDVTNCDDGTIGSPDKLFLAGTTSGNVDNGYNFSGSVYTYDDETLGMYGDTLKLANTNYRPKQSPEIKSYPAAAVVYGQKLKDISIENPSGNTPGVWNWQEPETSVGDAGQHKFKADFIPDDSNTYKSVKNVELTVNVSPKEVTAPAVIIGSDTYGYTGLPITPEVMVKDGSVTIPSSEYTVTYSNNTNIGKATVKVENKPGGNYKLTAATVEFAIEKVNLADAKVELEIPQGGYIYDKTAKEPAVTVNVDDMVFNADWYVVSYAQNVNAGEAVVTISSADENKCLGTANIRFTIKKRPIDITVTAEDKVYDGTAEAKITAKINESQIVSGDEVRLTEVIGVFADINPGKGKAVTVKADIAGKDAANYEVKIPVVTAAINAYDPAAVNQAIINANAAKEGVLGIDKEPDAVEKGVRFVSTEELNRFNEAIKKAEDARKNPLTKTQDEEIASELNKAIEEFKKLIRTGEAVDDIPEETETSEVVRPEETETSPEENQPEEGKPEESSPSGSQPEESSPSESQPEESHPEESTPEESRPEGSRPNTGGSSSGGSDGGGGTSGGGGRVSAGSSSGPSQGSVSSDSKKGQVNSVTGIVTGNINGSAGDGYSHWQQENAQEGSAWKLQYADGTYASGSMMADSAGNQYEQVAWEKVNGAWYAFGADANAKNGWVYDVGAAKWYYVDINTGMQYGWVMVNGIWYYLNPNTTGNSGRPFGAMYHNETTPDGYFVREDGSWDGGAKK